MTEALHDSAGRRVTLGEVTDENWRDVADVAPRDDQRAYVAALAARYLLLADRDGIWHSLAVKANEQVVGHVMWAFDPDTGCHWIGGMVIDASEQRAGVGRAAIRAVVELLRTQQKAREVRLSVHPDNTGGVRLYLSEGFEPTGDQEGDETVFAREIAS